MTITQNVQSHGSSIDDVVSNLIVFPKAIVPGMNVSSYLPKDNSYADSYHDNKINNNSYPTILKCSIDNIDKKEILGVMNKAFSSYNKVVADDYFEIIKDKKPSIYLEENKKGGAVTYAVNPEKGEKFEYMCKLFVPEEFQGEKIASKSIEKIFEDHDKVAWRCCAANEEAIGMYDNVIAKYNGKKVKSGDYFVYMVGLSDDSIKNTVEEVSKQKKTVFKMDYN